MKDIKQNTNKGFTLVELAMVLFIVTLLLGAILPPLATQIQQKQIEQTQTQLNEIREIIFGYVMRNGYFPCPDCRDNTGDCGSAVANDGEEDIFGDLPSPPGYSQCATSSGNLPWSTLGVKGTDAWGNPFTYRVTPGFADRGTGSDVSGCTPDTVGVSFGLCSDGSIVVLDSVGGANVATDIPAIVVSHGKNWSEIPSADEAANLDGNVTFVYRDYAGDFDDQMIWISPHILRTKMLNAGILP